MIVKAYVSPHPPIILPEIGRGEEKNIQDTIDAMDRMGREIAEIRPDTLVISSPHAPMYGDGFFIGGGEGARGDFAQFKAPEVRERIGYDQGLVQKIMDNFTQAPLASPESYSKDLDHGTLIPIRFIHKYYRDFKVVRIGLSGYDSHTHFKLGKAVQKSVGDLGRKAVFIASGDLSHVLKDDGPYGFKEEGLIFDKKIIEYLKNSDFESVLNFPKEISQPAAECGLKSFQILAGVLDGLEPKGELYSYQGTFGVGYGVVGFTPEIEEDNYSSAKENTKDPYVGLAEKTIRAYIKEGKKINLNENLPREILEDQAGTFVTIHKNGDLRGCIGTIGPTTGSIGEEIIQNAISASTRDPRFPKLTEDELEDLEISVDVLMEPEPIETLDDLDVKKYGVIVSKDFRRGLLLPNLEGVDTPEYQVSIALQKAGISPDEDFKMERFEVIRHE